MTKLNYHLRHPRLPRPVVPVVRTEITLNCGVSIISAFVPVHKYLTLLTESIYRVYLGKNFHVPVKRFSGCSLRQTRYGNVPEINE